MYDDFLVQESNSCLNLRVEEEYIRAAPGGVGGVKTISNYAPVSIVEQFYFIFCRGLTFKCSSFLLLL